jgi:hypothetical protein
MLKPLQNLFYMLIYLKQYFTLGVEDGDPAPPADDPPADDPPADDPPADDDEPPEDDDDPPAAASSDDDEPPKRKPASDVIRQQREETQRERERAIRAEALLEAERARAPQQPARQDPTYEQEEQRLKQLDLSTEQGRLEKWQIESNRSIRATEQRSQMSEFRAQDMYDRSSFEGYMRDKHPGLFKAYASKVEEKLAEARKSGANPNRLVLFKLIYGEDLLEGRVKSAPKSATKTGNAAGKQVPRGKSPGARSDVQGGRQTNKQKLEARLIGKSI